ncbi:MAG: hypothetical protein H7329_11200 [Opitutaceae bacterium]|nr:hypothetical protein [Cytophagales bacterium]
MSSSKQKYFESFQSEKIYHIYNHAVGNENLFRTRENYIYFLKKYSQYIHPVCKTFSYCLMPNHFHFLIEIRSCEELYNHFLILKPENYIVKPEEFNAPDFVMQQFSNLFNGYAKAYNKAFKRRGALFNDYLRRKLVDQDRYYSILVYYIHANPVHHKFCKNISEWEFSSFESLLSGKLTKLEREQTIQWFGNNKDFADYHKNQLPAWKSEEMTELEFQ